MNQQQADVIDFLQEENRVLCDHASPAWWDSRPFEFLDSTTSDSSRQDLESDVVAHIFSDDGLFTCMVCGLFVVETEVVVMSDDVSEWRGAWRTDPRLGVSLDGRETPPNLRNTLQFEFLGSTGSRRLNELLETRSASG